MNNVFSNVKCKIIQLPQQKLRAPSPRMRRKLAKPKKKNHSRERAFYNYFNASECIKWYQQHHNRLSQTDTTRATAASGKAGARNSPDKERAGISKGAGLAIEARSLLILSYETIRNRITKAKPLIVLHDTMRKPCKGCGTPFEVRSTLEQKKERFQRLRLWSPFGYRKYFYW